MTLRTRLKKPETRSPRLMLTLSNLKKEIITFPIKST